MKKLLIACLVTVGALTAAPAMASSVGLTMTANGLSNNLGGAYIGPYTVEDNATGDLFKVICDDFTADTYIGESWTATVSNLTDLTGKFAGVADSLVKYDEVGFLATALFSGGTPCLLSGLACNGINLAADVQYALWQVFDPTGGNTAFSHISGNDLANATAWLSLAASQIYAPGAYSNLVIYTPTACINGPGCDPRTNANLPQEFVGIRTPEPSTLLMLGLALGAIVFFARRRQQAREFAAL